MPPRCARGFIQRFPREHNRRAAGNGRSLALQGPDCFQPKWSPPGLTRRATGVSLSPACRLWREACRGLTDSFWSQNDPASSRQKVARSAQTVLPSACHGAFPGCAPGRRNVPVVLVILLSRFIRRGKVISLRAFLPLIVSLEAKEHFVSFLSCVCRGINHPSTYKRTFFSRLGRYLIKNLQKIHISAYSTPFFLGN